MFDDDIFLRESEYITSPIDKVSILIDDLEFTVDLKETPSEPKN